MQEPTPESIVHNVTVQAPTARVFAVFTEELAAWWPPGYTWSKDTLDTIAIEPRKGGRCFERGPHGFECDWGRVLMVEPPERLIFAWQISPDRVPEPDPAKASEVEVRFTKKGPEETQVALAHRGFANHGEGAADYRAAMASKQGWPYMLGRFADAVN
jgi:uncharacterized protein YndB with AHSA1/START domain